MPCIDGVCGNVEILQACANYHAFDAGRQRFIPHIFRYIPGKCANVVCGINYDISFYFDSVLIYGTRVAIDRPKVISSTYSSSPPKAMPRAMVEMVISKGFKRLSR